MLILFSCEYPIHFDIPNLIPYVNGLYCLTIIASVVFSVFVEFPLARIVDFLMKKLLMPSPKRPSCACNDENENVKDFQLTDVKTQQ